MLADAKNAAEVRCILTRWGGTSLPNKNFHLL